MIRLDFSIALAVYLLISIGLLLCLWLFFKSKKFLGDFFNLNPRFIWYCTICTYTYFTTHKTEISQCPRCGSYNKAETEQDNG